jgi:amino acid transporter
MKSELGHSFEGDDEPPARFSFVSARSSHSSAPSSTLGVWGIAFLCFSCVAGGPFGIEAAVAKAGALITCSGLIAAGLFWGLPQALFTAELASALPVNGGPVVWVARAFGPRWGAVNACMVVFQQLCDIVLYPTLIGNYMAQLVPMDPVALYAFKLAVLCLAASLNLVGVEALSVSAAALTGLIMLPFLLLPIAAAAYGMSFSWGAIATVPPVNSAGAALFVSTILWNMQGWSEVGCLAGEVENAGRVFPPGMALAAGLVTFAYSAPVLFGVALSPDLTAWADNGGDGFFVSLANQVAPWMGVLVLISAALANLSTLLTSLAAYTRTLQAAARLGQVPLPCFQRNFSRWRTPGPAIFLYVCTTAALMWGLDFGDLVVMDSAFYLVGQLSVVGAFFLLKVREPELKRPYVFPGGFAGAAFSSVCATAVAVTALYLTVAGEPLSCAVVGGALVGALACTYAPLALPARTRGAIDAFFAWVEERGRAAEAEDVAEDIAAADRARASKRHQLDAEKEQNERLLATAAQAGVTSGLEYCA